MKKYIEEHLNSISSDELLNGRVEAFSLYAQCNGVKLGYNAMGTFRIIECERVIDFPSAESAVANYKLLVKEHQ